MACVTWGISLSIAMPWYMLLLYQFIVVSINAMDLLAANCCGEPMSILLYIYVAKYFKWLPDELQYNMSYI
jgi:hypothetical protein